MATMRNFSRYFVAPLARREKWGSLCEIGSQYGTNVDQLLGLTLKNYTVIDPCFDCDLMDKYAADARIRVLKCTSLEALTPGGQLPSGSVFDCIFIDGDHNWYTVFNELRLIDERALLRPGGYVFLHDVGWPYGRRDMYYQPDTIPGEFRRPFARKGMVRGQSALADDGGINPKFLNALEEGGPRNGVLTAVEDFLALHPGKYRFCRVRHQVGFGILQLRPDNGLADLSFYEMQAKALACNLLAYRVKQKLLGVRRRLNSLCMRKQ